MIPMLLLRSGSGSPSPLMDNNRRRRRRRERGLSLSLTQLQSLDNTTHQRRVVDGQEAAVVATRLLFASSSKYDDTINTLLG